MARIIQSHDIHAATQALKMGKTLIFATDTVVGVGVSSKDVQALERLFALKKRSRNKPISWLVDSLQAFNSYAAHLPDDAYRLASQEWPGALTLVVQASSAVLPEFSSDKGTLGLRMPQSKQTLQLIHALGCPIATSSANFSGKKPVSSIMELDSDFVKAADYILLSEEVGSGQASRVIDFSSGEARLLRA